MDVTVITGATVLAGDDLEPIPDATLVIDAAVIDGVGRAGDIPVPTGVEPLRLPDHVVMPGFIDAHVHIGFYEPHDVLAGGVTTARDLGWPTEKIFELVERSRSDDFDGPTILAVGPMFTAPGGYPARAGWAPPGTALEIADPESARTAVAALATNAAAIKIALVPPVGPVLDDPTLQAVVDAAHERDLRVTGHVSGLDQLRRALDAGVDELAHMLMSEETIPDATIDDMVRAGMAVVPTLSIRRGRDREQAIDNLRRLHESGGTIVYGTDLGNEGPRPGIDPSEVDAMADAGMSLIDIVRSATVGAARYLGLPDVGTIAPGRRADLVALRGELVDGSRLLHRVARVWRRGHAVT